MADESVHKQQRLSKSETERYQKSATQNPPERQYKPNNDRGKSSEKTYTRTSNKRKTRTSRGVKFPSSNVKFGSGTGIVKIEFLIGIFLILLSPLANSNIKPDKNYVRRIIAWMLSFMILFPLADSNNGRVSRLANWTGGILLLVISLRGTHSGFGVDVPRLLNTIVQKIQPQQG